MPKHYTRKANFQSERGQEIQRKALNRSVPIDIPSSLASIPSDIHTTPLRVTKVSVVEPQAPKASKREITQAAPISHQEAIPALELQLAPLERQLVKLKQMSIFSQEFDALVMDMAANLINPDENNLSQERYRTFRHHLTGVIDAKKREALQSKNSNQLHALLREVKNEAEEVQNILIASRVRPTRITPRPTAGIEGASIFSINFSAIPEILQYLPKAIFYDNEVYGVRKIHNNSITSNTLRHDLILISFYRMLHKTLMESNVWKFLDPQDLASGAYRIDNFKHLILTDNAFMNAHSLARMGLFRILDTLMSQSGFNSYVPTTTIFTAQEEIQYHTDDAKRSYEDEFHRAEIEEKALSVTIPENPSASRILEDEVPLPIESIRPSVAMHATHDTSSLEKDTLLSSHSIFQPTSAPTTFQAEAKQRPTYAAMASNKKELNSSAASFVPNTTLRSEAKPFVPGKW